MIDKKTINRQLKKRNSTFQ